MVTILARGERARAGADVGRKAPKIVERIPSAEVEGKDQDATIAGRGSAFS
jgi:hypothetical protein